MVGGFCTAAHAELRALLVGVSSYPTLAERYRLEGPRNDVQRMHQVLLQRGFAAERIETLADGVPGASMPTRDNIFNSLGRLADVARPGDIVFILFAGHGSQEPADRDTAEGRGESNGLHETFLPIDVGTWDGGRQHVARAIVNVELRAAVDRITARGAFVWGVFDACHSATLVRGGAGGGDLRYRRVDPRDLGVRQVDLDRAATASASRGAPRADAGALGNAAPTAVAGSAFFYAAQTTELTPELSLPLGSPDRKRHGLFSFVVAKALETAQPMSYRQLAQYILSEYAALADAHATPLFSGSGLDRTVLGQRTLPVRQWPLGRGATLTIGAGTLSGIEAGAVFAVVPGPLASADKVIGHLEVAVAEAARAELVPVTFAGRAAPSPDALPPTAFVRLVRDPPQFTLRVSLQRPTCIGDCPLADAIARLERQGVPGTDVAWVDAASGADIVLQQHKGEVLFAPPTAAELRPPLPAIALRQGGGLLSSVDLAARIADELHLIARSRNLLRVAARLAAETPSAALRLSLQRRSGSSGALQPVSADAVPALKDGDRLVLTVENRGAVALDLTVLYFDADLGITALFPNRLGESNRVDAGGRKVIDDIDIHAPPAGIEHLMLIAVEAQRLAERADFSFLQQPALTVRRGGASFDGDVFADAAFAEFRTRGAARPAAPKQGTAVQLFTLQVQR